VSLRNISGFFEKHRGFGFYTVLVSALLFVGLNIAVVIWMDHLIFGPPIKGPNENPYEILFVLIAGLIAITNGIAMAVYVSKKIDMFDTLF